MPWASNATFLVRVGDAPRASTSRCAASGRCGTSSPACTAGGRRLPAERGDGHRRRPADGAARRRARSARARCSGSSTPTTVSTTSRSPSSGPTCTTSCGRSPCSTSSPTTPTARAVTACWRRVGSMPTPPQRVWAIDNGLCFAPDFKLRTVIWEFAGESLPDALVAACCALVEAVPADVAELLDDDEVEAAAPPGGVAGRAPACCPATTAATATPGRSSDRDGRRRRPRRADPPGRPRRARAAGRRRRRGAGDWPRLRRLRDAPATPSGTGRQLWPAATLAEYRLALLAPAEWAAGVLDEGSGRFTIGPLTEVVAQHHTWAELAPLLDGRPRAALVAHERALRGEAIEPASRRRAARRRSTCRTRWRRGSPTTPLADYRDDGAEFPSRRRPPGWPRSPVPADVGDGS